MATTVDSTLTSSPPDTGGLPRLLGARSLTALGLGGIIGVGIFVNVGIAARTMAGPAIVLSFLIAAVACIFIGFCYAEFASRIPSAGSAYSYARATLGRGAGWFIGWNLILSYCVAGASVAQGLSGYLESLLQSAHLSLPAAISSSHAQAGSAGRLDLPAVCITLVVAAVAMRGLKPSVRLNGIMLGVKLAALALVVGVGAFYVHAANWSPFAPFGLFTLRRLPGAPAPQPAGILPGAILAFFAFLGFDMLPAYCAECKSPRRDIPIAILASILLCAGLYMAVAAVLTGMVPYSKIDPRAPVAAAFQHVGFPAAQAAISVAAIAAITTVLEGLILSLPRILTAMGEEKLLPPAVFRWIHPEHRTPARSIALIGAAVGLLAGFGRLSTLLMLAGGAMVLCLAVICCSLPIIRRRERAGDRASFHAPLGPLMPVLGFLSCLALVMPIPVSTWGWLLLWMAIGAAVYLSYGRRFASR